MYIYPYISIEILPCEERGAKPSLFGSQEKGHVWFLCFTNKWSSSLIFLNNGCIDAGISKHPNAKTEIVLLSEKYACIFCLLREQNNFNIITNGGDPLYVVYNTNSVQTEFQQCK